VTFGGYGRAVPPKKRKPIAALVNSPKMVSVVLAVVALGCIVGAGVAYMDAVALRDHGVTTVGEVVDIHGGRSKYVVVRFRNTTGAEVSAEVGNYSWEPKPRVGDHPELVFDPGDPAGNVADARTGPDFLSVWLWGLGAALAGALMVPTRTGRLDWNKL
jgi:Protein of unknown function (DUF3592)